MEKHKMIVWECSQQNWTLKTSKDFENYKKKQNKENYGLEEI